MYTKFWVWHVLFCSYIPSKQFVSHVRTHVKVVIKFGAGVSARNVLLSADVSFAIKHVWLGNKHVRFFWMSWKLKAAKKIDFKPWSQSAIKLGQWNTYRKTLQVM